LLVTTTVVLGGETERELRVGVDELLEVAELLPPPQLLRSNTDERSTPAARILLRSSDKQIE
jgi:hypothetical protein